MSDSDDRDLPLTAQLEGLLFVAAEPVASTELADALRVTIKAVEAGLAELEIQLVERGLRLQRIAGRVQLTTASPLAGAIQRFLRVEGGSPMSRSGPGALGLT